jgi:hypothetical protein
VKAEHPGRRGAHTLALLGIISLASVLRFWRLGDWSLGGDELFTLRDSLTLRPGNPRPIIYFLNHYLVGPLLPLDEFGLRLLPAVFGVLAIPALYLVGRRLVGPRAVLFGGFLLAVNPLHLYHSQNARYWSLVFLLSAVYPFCIYLGIRDRDRRTLVLGVVIGVLAVLAHPTSILLVGGLGMWFLTTHLSRDRVRQFWSRQSTRWIMILVVVGVGIIAVRYILLLRSWIVVRPGVVSKDYLLFTPGGAGVTQLSLMLSYMDGLTVPLVLAAAVGIYLLWQRGERSLALLLVWLFVVPVGFLLLLSFRTSVGPTYFLPAAPIPFIAAGVFLDRLAGVSWELRPRWLIPATVVVAMVTAGVPTLLSQYRDGRRFDFRGAAAWLNDRLAPADVVFSDQRPTMVHYLPGARVQQLTADTAQLARSARELGESGHGGTLWVVAPYSARGSHRTNPSLPGFKAWVYQNCRLRNAFGVARLDYRVNELQVFECPPISSPTGIHPRADSTEDESLGAGRSPLRANTSRYTASHASTTRPSP